MAKLTTAERKARLLGALEEQRHFLNKSVTAMSAGDLAEALRIATVIRVLVHESASSTPLLKQLTQDYLQLRILDEIPKKQERLPPGVQATVVLSVPIGLKLSQEGVLLNPVLAPENLAPSIIGKWWERPCLILPGLGGFSRKQVVLGLVNKEGGAHVDFEISQRYQQLMDNKSLRVGWNEEPTPVKVSRMMAGQAGVEMLDCLNRNFPPKVTPAGATAA
jgi:hypothetical protein